MPCEVSASGASMMSLGALGGSGISVELYGDDTRQMLQAARQTAQALAGVPGIASVDDGVGETEPEIRFVVNKDKAMKEGLTTAQVYMHLAQAFATEAGGPSVDFDGRAISVRIVGGDEDALTPAYIKYYRFPVTTRNGEEKTVSIRDVADIVETETTASIARVNQRRVVTVSATVESGRNVTLAAAGARRALAGETLPDGVSYQFAGENETIMESLRELIKMLGLGVLLVYLIMVAQFQSLRSPFIVMFTIPLAFTGGLLALLITGNELSVVALIGMVMLVGVIVNNGIVLVDYINQLRLDGMNRREAILDAGVTRMRPILMTSLTTILGLLVMALGRGTGSEMMQPIAIVCIGGLLYATLLTLFVVPVMYELFSRHEMRKIEESDLAIVTD
jgi:HAE1 family hydrophobic/amphiphilic exporter-1